MPHAARHMCVQRAVYCRYTPEDIPGLTCYLPPLLDQPLLEGAPEELGLGGTALVPSGTVPPLSDYPGLPDACKQMPYITLEIGNRYSDDKVMALPEPSWGMVAGYLVQVCGCVCGGWVGLALWGGVSCVG